MSCLFCYIVEGKIPASKVLENDDFIAFRDIHPQSPTHVLVIPKKHYTSLNDVPDTEFEKITGGLHRMARDVVQELRIAEAGYRTVINTGKWGGQSVFHLHLHILGGRQLGGSMVG